MSQKKGGGCCLFERISNHPNEVLFVLIRKQILVRHPDTVTLCLSKWLIIADLLGLVSLLTKCFPGDTKVTFTNAA